MTAGAWDVYARSKEQRRLVNATGDRTWFNWTQYPDHGPGAQLLDPRPGVAVLDLGCGKGGNVAHLATLGVQSTGVDWSRPQIEAAWERWADLPGLDFVIGDAVDYLRTSTATWHAVYSVFGVVWFCDPEILLPLIQQRLRPRGLFAFSQLPPADGCDGAQAAFVRHPDTDEALPVSRWDYPPETWRDELENNGFDSVDARIIPPPEDSTEPGTLLVRARKTGPRSGALRQDW